jgi:hypothetical protein
MMPVMITELLRGSNRRHGLFLGGGSGVSSTAAGGSVSVIFLG